MRASRRSSARSLAVVAVAALLGGGPLAAQETGVPTDRPATESPPQAEPPLPTNRPTESPLQPETAPPAESPAARPDRPADADPAAAGAPPPSGSPAARPGTAGDPPPLPASLEGVPEPVLALHVSTTFCEDPSGPPLAGHAALVSALSPTAVLVGIPCHGDASRAAFRLYVLETGEIGGVHAQFLALPSKSLGWTGTDVLWSPTVDAEGRLTGTLYDPGEGRCASRGRWRWTGYALAMQTAEIDDGCGGSGGWRTVFP